MKTCPLLTVGVAEAAVLLLLDVEDDVFVLVLVDLVDWDELVLDEDVVWE